jgi:hypothetical protein
MWPTWKLLRGWWMAYRQAAFVGERWANWPNCSICQCGHVAGTHWLIGRCSARATVQPFRLFGRVIITVRCRCTWTFDEVRDGSGPRGTTWAERRENILRERRKRR